MNLTKRVGKLLERAKCMPALRACQDFIGKSTTGCQSVDETLERQASSPSYGEAYPRAYCIAACGVTTS